MKFTSIYTKKTYNIIFNNNDYKILLNNDIKENGRLFLINSYQIEQTINNFIINKDKYRY
jgi:hypothetical protein